jgi:hypothetical protein
MRVRTIVTLGFFIIVLLLATVLASCSNADQRPMDSIFGMLPHPLATSPVGLVITDPVFRQQEPDPLIKNYYEAAALEPLTSEYMWNCFTKGPKGGEVVEEIDLTGTQITNADMVGRLVGIPGKPVIKIVTEQGYFLEPDSAPFITQLTQAGNVTIKTDNDGISRQMHSRYAVITSRDASGNMHYRALASSGDFLDDSFNTSINNTVIFEAQRNYVDGAGANGVKSIIDAFLFDFDQMFNMGRFGGDKERLINHTFNVGIDVELYFGPNDNLFAEINDEAQNMVVSDPDTGAKRGMMFMINQVSDTDMLGLLNAYANQGIYDNLGSPGLGELLTEAQTTPFAWADNEFRAYNTLNHKVMLMDVPNFEDALSPVILNAVDPVVITGSCNWTYAGIRLNDEQLLIIHDQTMSYEMYVELQTLSLEAQGNGVLFGRVHTHTDRPINQAEVSADSLAILGSPFRGAGADGIVGQTDARGIFAITVPAGLLRNIRLTSLGDGAGGFMNPTPIWNDPGLTQGYNLLPGSSFEINFFLEPIPTNTGTGNGGGGGFGG